MVDTYILEFRSCLRSLQWYKPSPLQGNFISEMAKAKTKIIIRRAWTKDDVRQMKTMAKAKSGVKKIAKALKRTPGATTVMAAKLGVSLSMGD
jgi:hypothetical protein